MSPTSPSALPIRIATSGPRRSATAPHSRKHSVVAPAVMIPMIPTSASDRSSRSTLTMAYSGAAAIRPPP